MVSNQPYLTSLWANCDKKYCSQIITLSLCVCSPFFVSFFWGGGIISAFFGIILAFLGLFWHFWDSSRFFRNKEARNRVIGPKSEPNALKWGRRPTKRSLRPPKFGWWPPNRGRKPQKKGQKVPKKGPKAPPQTEIWLAKGQHRLSILQLESNYGNNGLNLIRILRRLVFGAL